MPTLLKVPFELCTFQLVLAQHVKMKGKFDSVSFGFQPLIHFLPGHWDTEMAFWLVLGLMSIDIIVVLHEKCRSQHMNKASAMAVLQSRLDQLEIARQAQMNAEHTQSLNEISWGNQIRSYVLHVRLYFEYPIKVTTLVMIKRVTSQ